MMKKFIILSLLFLISCAQPQTQLPDYSTTITEKERDIQNQMFADSKVSQGYANFRFKSKDNLLISSLQYLSDEYKKSWQKIFEEKNIDPIDRIIRIIQNDFSSKIANRNKISVWIAFYSEVKFRPSYLAICQRQDEIYSQQMEKLVSEINNIANQKEFTPNEVSETYHSMVDGLWQRILFDPKIYTNEFCKNLVLKYFKSIYVNEDRFA